MSEKNKIQLYAGIFAVLFVCIVVAFVVLNDRSFETSNNDTTQISTNEQSDSTNSPTTPSTNQTADQNGLDGTTGNGSSDQASGTSELAQKYRDGVYSATGTYASPASPNESVTVELSLENGVVRNLNVTANADNSTSQANQRRFVQGINGEVVGKDIDSVNPGVVNGSSLTSGGFNAAISQIKDQALVQ